ncbi:uncharacterized protein MAM_07556 [Metarhizium album ARSEF 1941]|uniref:Uncharacterized protein n=1 Tax=Metarhizium album (strain ARSEF 1941) TaxID=1081103 RepID=A0A0B2WNS2_METAS|nr:uncharacterized protein MAM_07556 [Metarhizium album ARSEF 1941]KHN94650.1 hypothetical protein MAM_07556 [Metarhizium album ARSEF 1941]
MTVLRPFPPVPRSTTRSYATARTPGPTSRFYKTFTRPVAKVLLVAVFTYQVVYWAWVKLDADEHRRKTDAEIADLEARVTALDKARKADVETKDAAKPKKGWW